MSILQQKKQQPCLCKPSPVPILFAHTFLLTIKSPVLFHNPRFSCILDIASIVLSSSGSSCVDIFRIGSSLGHLLTVIFMILFEASNKPKNNHKVNRVQTIFKSTNFPDVTLGLESILSRLNPHDFKPPMSKFIA